MLFKVASSSLITVFQSYTDNKKIQICAYICNKDSGLCLSIVDSKFLLCIMIGCTWPMNEKFQVVNKKQLKMVSFVEQSYRFAGKKGRILHSFYTFVAFFKIKCMCCLNFLNWLYYF